MGNNNYPEYRDKDRINQIFISYIIGADPIRNNSKWVIFWRKFGFYKNRFSQSGYLITKK